MKPIKFRQPRQQRGVALFVALIFLVVLTILGVTALNNNNLQTRMAAGTAQTNFAFQSAEIGVNAGEAWIELQTSKPVPNCTAPCASNPTSIWPRYGLATPVVTPDLFATSSTWFTNNGRPFSATQTVYDPASHSLTPPEVPRYIIEELGPDGSGSLVVGQGSTYKTYYYQVSGRGVSGQPNINTVTQSVYAKGF